MAVKIAKLENKLIKAVADLADDLATDYKEQKTDETTSVKFKTDIEDIALELISAYGQDALREMAKIIIGSQVVLPTDKNEITVSTLTDISSIISGLAGSDIDEAFNGGYVPEYVWSGVKDQIKSFMLLESRDEQLTKLLDTINGEHFKDVPLDLDDAETREYVIEQLYSFGMKPNDAARGLRSMAIIEMVKHLPTIIETVANTIEKTEQNGVSVRYKLAGIYAWIDTLLESDSLYKLINTLEAAEGLDDLSDRVDQGFRIGEMFSEEFTNKTRTNMRNTVKSMIEGLEIDVDTLTGEQLSPNDIYDCTALFVMCENLDTLLNVVIGSIINDDKSFVESIKDTFGDSEWCDEDYINRLGAAWALYGEKLIDNDGTALLTAYFEDSTSQREKIAEIFNNGEYVVKVFNLLQVTRS